jgi:hypothetical protein
VYQAKVLNKQIQDYMTYDSKFKVKNEEFTEAEISAFRKC